MEDVTPTSRARSCETAAFVVVLLKSHVQTKPQVPQVSCARPQLW